MSLLGVLYNNWVSVPAQEKAAKDTMKREMRMRGITEHKSNLVEYETENGYISVVRAGNLFAVGIKWGDEELEEFLTDTQASHLMAFISKFVVNTGEDDA